MGIKSLGTLLKRSGTGSGSKIKLTKLSELGPNKIVAIDTAIYFHKFLCSRTPENFLISFLNQINNFLRFGIQPIYVFDGPPRKEKTIELLNRSIQKEKGRNRVKELELQLKNEKNSAEKKQLLKKISSYSGCKIRILSSHIKKLKMLLTFLGIKYYTAAHDAEAMACWLAVNGHADYVLSEDTDCYAFGAPILIRGYKNTSCPKVSVVSLKENILNPLRLKNLSEFIDLTILLGNDFNMPIITPVLALKLINEYSSIDNIPAEKLPENIDRAAIQKVRDIYNLTADNHKLPQQQARSDPLVKLCRNGERCQPPSIRKARGLIRKYSIAPNWDKINKILSKIIVV